MSKSPLTLRESVQVIGMSVLIAVIGWGGLLMVLLLARPPLETVFTTLALAVPTVSLAVLVCVYRYLKIKKISWVRIGFRPPTWRLLHLLWQIPLSLLVLVITQAIFFSIFDVESTGRSDVIALLSGGVSIFPAIALLMGVVLFVPFLEEVLFRGVIYGGLRRKWSVLPALIFSGGVFAVAHAVPLLLPYFTVLGILLAYLYEFHKTLWASLIMHVSINSLASVTVILSLVR